MGLNREGRRVDKFVYCSLDFISGLKLQKFFYMWHSPLNGIGRRRMVPFAIYSLPDSRVKCLSPLVGVPVIAHQQRLTFSCSSPFRCSHLTPSSSLFLIHSPYRVYNILFCAQYAHALYLFFSSRDETSQQQLVLSQCHQQLSTQREREKGRDTTGANYVKLGQRTCAGIRERPLRSHARSIHLAFTTATNLKIYTYTTQCRSDQVDDYVSLNTTVSSSNLISFSLCSFFCSHKMKHQV